MDTHSPPSTPKKRRVARMVGLLALALAAPLVFLGIRWGGGNLGVLEPGAYYRSGQLGVSQLQGVIRRHGIRTVLNLRGPNPEEPWYRAERAATLAAGAQQVDLALATDHWLSRPQMAALIDTLQHAPRPMLIHCQWGSERTGLVSGLVELVRPGGSLASAREQFSLYYLYLPTREGRIMGGHVEAYARWLERNHQAHTPETFLNWARTTYQPGFPSRDDWPFDPYPLLVRSISPNGPTPSPVARTARNTETSADVTPR